MRNYQEPEIPAYYVLQALSSGFLVNPQQVPLESLQQPDARIPLRLLDQFVPRDESARPLSLAIKFADQVRLSSQGILSMVLMTSPTLRDALQVSQYVPLLTNAASINFTESPQAGYLFIDIHVEDEFLSRILRFYALTAIHRLMVSILGCRPDVVTRVSEPLPDTLDDDALALIQSWQFDAPACCLVFPREWLDRPGQFADPVAHDAARRECRDKLAAERLASDLLGQIKHLMAEKGLWEQDEVAASLHMSRSTLKRRLALQGTSFNQLLNDTRKQKAIRLLSDSEMSFQDIAEALGYSDRSNFSHAFKKWLGVAPGEFRKELV